MSSLVRQTQYAVRGTVVIRAGEHEEALARGEKRPFSSVVYCNIGNPQQLGQAPMTFVRQVLAACDYPALLSSSGGGVFPADVVARASKYLSRIPGGTGAYSHSQGVPVVREEVAGFLRARDGVNAFEKDIFLTDGASPAVQLLMRSMLRAASDTVLIPIPQYPLYTASIALFGGTAEGYYLDEDKGWATTIAELSRAYDRAHEHRREPRAVAVINPGNPTGGVLSREAVAAVAHFCADRHLVLMADEVYQENVWAAGAKFHSFKKVAAEEGLIDPNDASGTKSRLQLASFHSVSKGFLGECGRRGGYVELVGFDESARAELYKVASISLCSNIAGQLTVGLMVNPPKPGDHSHALWVAERDAILASLKRRAKVLADSFAQMRGVTCNAPEGAMYIFPRISLPPKAVQAAKDAPGGPIAPDLLYCLQLLDQTGIVVVPGSGFGQRDGTFHFRTTILPPEEQIEAVARKIVHFHNDFLAKYQ
jgi:alanine transaminase